jgi:DNA replication protein DnaC
MNARIRRKNSRACTTDKGGTLLALSCARNVYATVGRGTPEASALLAWLKQSSSAFALPDAAVPGDAGMPARSRRVGVSVQDWRKLGTALDLAQASLAPTPPATAARWIEAIGAALDLDPLALRILALSLTYHLDQRVEQLFDMLSECRGGPTMLHRDAGLFALLLQAPAPQAATALATSGKLLAGGLLSIERHGELAVLHRLLSLIRQDIAPGNDFFAQLLGSADIDLLPWDAFAHLGREADTAAALLRAAVTGRERGISILLYGPPGTGKTSFAAALAARIGARLRSVGEADDDGGEPSRYERLAGLRLAQRLATPGETLLLFDEAEDVFVRHAMVADEPVAATSRVFIHRLLETLPVPVIWTANDIGALGPAVLRRMTMCLQIRIPNLATRTSLWCRMGEAEGIELHAKDAARLARLVPAAPAVASSALRAARLSGGGAEAAQLIVEGVARAIGRGRLPLPEADPDGRYDPALVNADCDLAALTDTLSRPGAPRAVSFLLSGPPGAGKSAWVRHLAGRMGMPVLQKRASDLLDPFVGGTEHRIAAAFAEAREARAFLVFDEADSLLLDRADAVRSWEISQVNEMLTWMEAHELPFACTTNLEERLDRASLRRFLVKIRFGWLSASQAKRAFRSFFGLPAPPQIEALTTLTPADFALVHRRADISFTLADPSALLAQLAAESKGRLGGRLRVGFSRHAAE